jgi:cyanophycin synthetase
MHKQLPLDDEVSAYLARHGHSADSVPAADERVYLTGASNIHRGGDALDATDELTPAEVELAQEASKQIPGLRLAALDLLLPRREGDGDPLVLEVNANPMISMHHLPWEGTPRNAAGAILAAMFPTL